MPNPFLTDDFYIRWSTLTPEIIVSDIETALASAAENIDAVAGTDRGRMSFSSTLLSLESATEQLSRAWGLVGHLDSVCNSPELREAHNEVLPKVSEFFAKIPLNDGLWDLLKTFAVTPDAKSLTGIQKRFFEETIADFNDAGADLPPDKKRRLEQLEADLSKATQKFSENVLDSTNDWELIIEDPEVLNGLPATARDAALASATEKGIATPEKPAWRFTLHAPSYGPLMEHLDDRDTRKTAWRGSTAIGRSGEHDNTDLVWKILALRQEKAELLGKANFAEVVLERRMAKSGEAALKFSADLHQRIKAAFDRESIELQEYRADSLHEKATVLDPWDSAYWAERRRKQLYDFDDEDLRPYFPIDGVLDGMFRLVETIFEIKISSRETIYIEPGTTPSSDLVPASEGGPVEVWAPDVKFFEIFTPKGIHLGSFYADWHPRESKRSGAWMNYLITGHPPTGDEDRKPHLGLICGNLTPPAGDRPALLTHYEVETVFHEFGHLLHHLLGEVEIRSLNGVNVAWDFVELPSQIMENFCWERQSLDFFARHFETGKPIPAKLFRRMLAARNYMSASSTMRQLAFGKLDLELHINHASDSGRDLDELTTEVLEGYTAPLATRPPSIARRFTHLFASSTGYAAGYYSYKWAEVLDADAFTRFQKEGVLSSEVGRDFKNKILSRGNSEPPEKLFRDFMGRDPEITPLLVRAGLA